MMKRLIPIILVALSIVTKIENADAQAFSLSASSDTARENSGGLTSIDVHNDIIASVDTLRITWKVVDYHYAPKIALEGFCDNKTCVLGENLSVGVSNVSDPYDRNIAGTFKATFTDSLAASPMNAVSWLKVQAVGGTTTRNVVFMLNNTPAGIFSTVREEAKVAVSPNPASDQVTVSYEPTAKIRVLAIYDMTGREVSSMKAISDQSSSINVSNLASGMYFIRFVNANGEIVAIKRLTRK